MVVESGSISLVISIYWKLSTCNYLVQCASIEPWFHATCTDIHVSMPRSSDDDLSSGRMLQCLYFNACSIYPKHSNLEALLVALNFDSFVITETFVTGFMKTDRNVTFCSREIPF